MSRHTGNCELDNDELRKAHQAMQSDIDVALRSLDRFWYYRSPEERDRISTLVAQRVPDITEEVLMARQRGEDPPYRERKALGADVRWGRRGRDAEPLTYLVRNVMRSIGIQPQRLPGRIASPQQAAFRNVDQAYDAAIKILRNEGSVESKDLRDRIKSEAGVTDRCARWVINNVSEPVTRDGMASHLCKLNSRLL